MSDGKVSGSVTQTLDFTQITDATSQNSVKYDLINHLFFTSSSVIAINSTDPVHHSPIMYKWWLTVVANVPGMT